MAENSKIEWTHHTFNPWIGCQKVGPGCDNCYAEAMMADRYGRVEWGPHGARSRTSPANWRKPLAWDRAAAAAGERQRVFCASLADVFDNHPSVLPEWREDLWRLIEATPNLDWMLLTKRPGNIANMLPVQFDFARLYPNVWLGCTVVHQGEADRDIPKLLAVPARVRFLSMEPLLGPVDLIKTMDRAGYDPVWSIRQCGLHLVIVGGESGHGARPMHPDWVRDLRDQCEAASTAFFFKQWGDWLPWEMGAAPMWNAPNGESEDRHNLFPADMDADPRWDDGIALYSTGDTGHAAFERVGKARAGRLIDGRTWGQMPEVAQ